MSQHGTRSQTTAQSEGSTVRAPEPDPARRRAATEGGASVLLDLQHELGNRRTAGLLRDGGVLQASLRIGPTNDRFEREADRTADRVVREAAGETTRPAVSPGARPAVQRMCSHCEEELQREPLPAVAAISTPRLQRTCAECEEELANETVQRDASDAGAGGPASAGLESRVASLRGHGSPLTPALRAFFEPRFGHDLGDVRLHTGAAAADAARQANARAFTVGRDVAFGAGEYRPASGSGRRLLAHELTHVIQQTPEALRRQPIETTTEAPAALVPTEEEAPPEAEMGTEPSTTAPTPEGGRLLVEDEAPTAAGQMTKTEFLDRLRPAVCAAAEEGLAGTEHSARGCPWIDHYLRLYASRTADRLEDDLRTYAPSSASARSAAELVPLIADHVRESVRHWAETGEVTGVPEGVPLGLPGMGLVGAMVGALAQAGSVLFQSRGGGSSAQPSPLAVRARLGAGSPLPSAARMRMEGAFGTRFGHVRVHRGPTAARLSNRYRARAFTIGSHVAFGAGEYRPGSLLGDALMAHELAHVTHQRDHESSARSLSSTSSSGPSTTAVAEFEDRANRTMATVVSRLLRPGGVRGSLRSSPKIGLRLQRCSSDTKVRGRPGTGLDPGLPPGVETQEYSMGEYIRLWEEAAGRKMTDEERRRLAAGCVGITRLNLGGSASLAECYDAFDDAKRRAAELETQTGKKHFIFSKRFWSMGAAYPTDPATGRVDMSAYSGATPPGEVNFDYGWYDEANNTWWHANHCDPVIAGGSCARAYTSTERMRVYQSTLAHYSDPNYFGADKQVFCVAWSRLQ